jgi:cold shock protein
MHQGIVIWFSVEKGFGLIKTDSGKEIFVHYTAILLPGLKTDLQRKSLTAGQRVSFDMYETPKGHLAKNVFASA